MTVIELREKRVKLWAAMEGFLDTHRNEKGVLSAEDDATYAAMEKDLADLTTEVKRMERRDATEAELRKPTAAPITEKHEKPSATEKAGRASSAYREDFGRHLRGRQPIHNVLSESVDADGGYLVPEEFEKEIVAGLDDANVIRSIAKVIVTCHDRKIPVSVGHSVATWTAENAAFTESNPTFDQKQIDAFKLTDLIRVSVELLQDSEFDLEGYIAAEFARAFGIAEEQAFCVGTGSNQPTGIFTANGGEIVLASAKSNLRAVVGSGTKYESRATGELANSLGLSPPKVNRNGDHDIKVGFAEPHSGGVSNAKLASILEHGKHGQPAKPFLKPAKSASKNACIEAMKAKLESKVKGP